MFRLRSILYAHSLMGLAAASSVFSCTMTASEVPLGVENLENTSHQGQELLTVTGGEVEPILGDDPSGTTTALPAVPPSYGDSLKIVAYNIWMKPGGAGASSDSPYKQFRADWMLSQIDWNADVLVFSEAFDSSVQNGSCSGSLSCTDDASRFKRALNSYGYSLITPNVDDGFFDRDGDGGVFIATKLPTSGFSWRSRTFGETCDGNDCWANKGIVYVRVFKNGLPYHVFGTHLNAGWGASGVATRGFQLGIIRRFIWDQDIPQGQPVFVAGDLNVDRWGAADMYGDAEYSRMRTILISEEPTYATELGTGTPYSFDKALNSWRDVGDNNWTDRKMYDHVLSISNRAGVTNTNTVFRPPPRPWNPTAQDYLDYADDDVLRSVFSTPLSVLAPYRSPFRFRFTGSTYSTQQMDLSDHFPVRANIFSSAYFSPLSVSLRPAAASGMCLDVPGGGTGPTLQAFACHGGANQQWNVLRADESTGTFLVQSEATKLCLQASSTGPVTQQVCDSQLSQQWTFTAPNGLFGTTPITQPTGRSFALKNAATGRFLAVTSSGVWSEIVPDAQAGMLALYGFELRTEQVQARTYVIKSADSQKCLDIPGGTTSDTSLQEYTCHNGINQQWEIRPVGRSAFEVRSLASRKCMDATGVQRTCSGATTQQFYLRSRSDRNFDFVPVSSPTTCISASKLATSSYLTARPCDATAADKDQAWYVRPVQ